MNAEGGDVNEKDGSLSQVALMRSVPHDTLPLGTRRLPDKALFDLDEDVIGERGTMDEDQVVDEEAVDEVFAALE